MFVEPAPAERSHVSLSSCTGSASTRVFQMFESGKTRQADPGTGWATAADGAIAEPMRRREASALAARFR
jgi:hypothetical protein